MESDMESSGSLTLNTLSMISTPWVTESFDVKTFTEPATLSDMSSLIWDTDMASSTTVQPRTSSSYGAISPPLRTDCDTTLTILCNGVTVSTSPSLKPPPREHKTPDTISSWTLEYFTSSGCITDVDSTVVRAKYPWSLDTAMSGTDLDLYPSTKSLTARKGSRATISTAASNRQRERGHVAPLDYIGLNSKPGEKPYLDWALGNFNGISMGDSLNAAIAV